MNYPYFLGVNFLVNYQKKIVNGELLMVNEIVLSRRLIHYSPFTVYHSPLFGSHL